MKNKKFKRVAVLKGGPSAEREVSLRSGAAVARGLREAGYDAVEVDAATRALRLPEGVDGVFITLHGEFGEDGSVQRLLDGMGIPYTGAGAEASAIAFNKKRAKEIMIERGIPTPGYCVVGRAEDCTLPLPYVVKPVSQGSSIGVHRVFRGGDIGHAFADAFKYGDKVLVETFIPGRELTVGIVGSDVLPVIEIVAPGDWYSYEAKYTSGQSRYDVPARLPAAVAAATQAAAWRTYEALGCRGLGRVDLRVNDAGEVFVLELNTIPGFTETSLLPKAAGAAGINFAQLCDRIMQLAQLG